MKSKLPLSLLSLCLGIQVAGAQGTAFNYQGKIDYNGGPANGFFHFQFQIYSNATVGSAVSPQLVYNNIWVSNGLFNLTLDFGSAPFNGRPLWMQLGVAPATLPQVPITLLSPRSPISPSPYAFFAANASNAVTAVTATTASTATSVAANSVGAAALQNSSITANKIASGNVVKTFNGLTEGVSLVGGSNVTITTTGSNTIIVSANSSRLGTPSTVGSVLTASDTNGNGAWNTRLQVISADRKNGNVNTHSVNLLGGYNDVVANGTIGATALGGGFDRYNLFTFQAAGSNYVSGDFATAIGGLDNVAAGSYSFAAGQRAKANHLGAFVWADSQASDYASTANNQFCVRASGGIRLDGGVTMNYNDIYLRENGNIDHGVGYRSRFDGPFLYGFNGGGLGVSPDFDCLTWDYNGNVWVSNTVTVAGFKLEVRGAGEERAYIGGDGIGGDVELGSENPAVANVSLWNRGTSTLMDLGCRDASVRALTIRGGADLAEPFQMTDAKIAKGSLVIIDEENPGKLKLAKHAYDTSVAGIVSGANGVNAGITLHQEGLIEGGQNVALSGRVYALADASAGAIKPGDLLTSSDTPGHVMKVSDHAKAQGAIVGKAMSALKEGKGMVLVLVSLQ